MFIAAEIQLCFDKWLIMGMVIQASVDEKDPLGKDETRARDQKADNAGKGDKPDGYQSTFVKIHPLLFRGLSRVQPFIS